MTLSNELKALQDADYPIKDLAKRYITLVDFVKHLKLLYVHNNCKSGCCLVCNAEWVLREIGEAE